MTQKINKRYEPACAKASSRGLCINSINFCMGPKEESKLEDLDVAMRPHSTCPALFMTRLLQGIKALEI